jgi:hypothetical protein
LLFDHLLAGGFDVHAAGQKWRATSSEGKGYGL